MKKLFSLFLALIVALSMFGCTQAITDIPTTEPSQSVLVTDPTDVPAVTDPSEETEPSTQATEPSQTTEPSAEPTEPATKPTEPKPTEPKPTEPKPTEPKPTEPPTEAPTEAPTEPPTEAPTEPKPSAEQLLVDKAFALAYGQSLSGTHSLTGTVTSVETIRTSKGDATFTVRVQGSTGSKSLYVYRGQPENSRELTVKTGDLVTLTGTLKNYKGTIEFDHPTYVNHSYDPSYDDTPQIPTETPSGGTVQRDGIYDSKDKVALYIHTYGCLPQNYVTKSQYNSMGEPADKCCGGDRFYNKEGLLPSKSGRLYYECDIDTLGKTSRGAKRIVFSNDGLVYYTSDHYESFTLLYGTP